VSDVKLRKQILYFEDVNLNENKTKGLAGPTEDRDGVNKNMLMLKLLNYLNLKQID